MNVKVSTDTSRWAGDMMGAMPAPTVDTGWALVPRAQRVGDALVTRAVFAGKRDFDVWHDVPASRQDL